MDAKDSLVLLHGSETAYRIVQIDRVEKLVADGMSRLTAQRIVEIERGEVQAGRARRHPLSHR